MRTTPLELSDQARDHMQKLHLMSVLGRVDSILAGRKIVCTLRVSAPNQKNGPSAPSWTDGRTITFNAPELPAVTDTNGLVVINGLNYHELAHVLYTPSADHRLVKKVRNETKEPLWQTFNMLEDQRIEGMLIAQYPAVAPYLTATVAAYFLDNKDWKSTRNAWAVIYGRKYLPQNMRDHFEQAFKQAHRKFDLARFESLVDEYKVFRFFRNRDQDSDRAFQIIREIAKMLRDQMHDEPPNPFAHNEAASGATEGDVGEPSPGETSDAEGKSNAGGPAGDEEGSDGAEGGDEDSDGADGDSDGNEDGKDGKKAGTSGEMTDPTNLIMSQTLKDIRSGLMVREELMRQRDVLRRMKASHGGMLPMSSGRMTAVSSISKGRAKKFGQELERIVEDQDPAFDKYRDAGKLNFGRYLRGDELDTVFDQWNEGNIDAASVETVVLIDISGSMGGNLREAMEAGWVVKAAHDALGGQARCTVLAFGTTCQTVYRSSHVVDRNNFRVPNSLGGTQPRDALADARDIMATTNRKHRIVITISDGAWSQYGGGAWSDDGKGSADGIMQQLRDAGVYTAALYIAGAVEVASLQQHSEKLAEAKRSHGHHATLFVPSIGSSEIVPLARRMVKDVMRGRR